MAKILLVDDAAFVSGGETGSGIYGYYDAE